MGGKRKDYEKLGEIASKIEQQGISYAEGADVFEIPVGDLYAYNYWAKRKQARALLSGSEAATSARGGDVSPASADGSEAGAPTEAGNVQEKEGLAKEGKDKDSIGRVPEEVQKLIVTYREDNPDHGYKKIEDHLKAHHLLVVSRKKIREVLKARGMEKTQDSSFDKGVDTAKGIRRFEAAYPRAVWQIDVTYVYLNGEGVMYLAVVVDDYSRFCVSAELCRDQKALTMIGVMQRAVDKYGKPEKLMSDQGSCFYTWSANPTIFQQYLDDMRIEHLVADPHSPQTMGKVERLNQTIKKELLGKVRFGSVVEAHQGIEAYFRRYNYERPHQGIKGARPADRFHGVIGEVGRIETDLANGALDFSKGYMVLRMGENSLSVAASAAGWQVMLNGKLLVGKNEKH